jgi:uncharacterized protein YjbI with pentapeptide repeats
MQEKKMREIIRGELETRLKTSDISGRSSLFKVVLTPITITIVGGIVSFIISYSDRETTKTIAALQVRTNLDIVKMQRKNQQSITDAELEVQRIQQINETFQKIISSPHANDHDVDATEANIHSLVVYKEIALPFLVRLRDHFDDILQEPTTPNSNTDKLKTAAVITISDILSKSQLDFTGMSFNPGEEMKELRNLRFAELKNHNLSNVDFSNCNLFNAKLMKSTLKNAKFINTDLYGANFEEANLAGSVFDGNTNLNYANFEKTKLDDVEFNEVKHLEDAKFSFKDLCKLKEKPFSDVDPKVYTSLLVSHKDELIEDDPNIDGILEKTHITSFRKLQEELDKLASSNANR